MFLNQLKGDPSEDLQIVVCPDGATIIDRRSGHCDLLLRDVIHRGTRTASCRKDSGSHIGSQDQMKCFEEPVMIRNYVLADVVTKVAYFSLVATAFVFVATLLITGMH